MLNDASLLMSEPLFCIEATILEATICLVMRDSQKVLSY